MSTLVRTLAAAAPLALLAACASSEPVGYKKTTSKTTIDTPTEKKTITETHEKDTRYYPPRD
jgi:hypothetical protein